MSYILPTRLLCRNVISQPWQLGLRSQSASMRSLHHQATNLPARTKGIKYTNCEYSSSLALSWAFPLAVLAAYKLSEKNLQTVQLESSKPLSGSSLGTSPPFSSTSSDTGIPYQGEMPKSDLNIYNLGFGTVCGICSGIFIKKGAKLIAFLLGGGFVLLQYLNTQRIVSVNWRSLSSRYNSVVSKAAGEDAISLNKSASGWTDSTAARIWNRSVHFLTADFPSRGTFVAGLLLGLRLG